ncbi:T9SS type A sorting domain-containing protein [candidate division KSB1 bacterium]|nr:T9SS type A sorting domain-containing protein [candidate division KSB1 bacterium]
MCAASAPAQPLDWWTDAAIFATTANEATPLLASSADGRSLMSICRSDPGGMALRFANNAGVNWRGISTNATGSTFFASCRHAGYVYVCAQGFDGVVDWYRFLWSDSDWEAAVHDSLAARPQPLTPAAIAMYSDAEFHSPDARVNTVWIEYQADPPRGWLRFAQGYDDEAPNSFGRDIAPPFGPSPESGVAICDAWSGAEERLLVAATIDRPGSSGPSLRLYRSENRGLDWSAEEVLDSSSSLMSDPVLCAWEQAVVLCYARRASASSPSRLYYTYSPDGGLSFAPVDSLPITFDHAVAPQLAVENDHEHFSLAFIAGEIDSAAGSVYVVAGSLAEPWTMEAPLQVSATNSARFDGGLSLTSNELGAAVAWSSRWQPGDYDVKWDASWRTEHAPSRANLTSARMMQAFPNPFNGQLTISLELPRSQDVRIDILNELGQRVRAVTLGSLSRGNHLRNLDFAGLASGRYYVQSGVASAPLRVTLIR